MSSGGASRPPLPAGATPTSISTLLGGMKREACQRSTGWSSGSWLPRSAMRQNGGGRMLSRKRAGDDLVAFGLRRRQRLIQLLLADAVGMHVRFVREVHQVVDQQAIVAANVVEPARERPVGIVNPVGSVDFFGVRTRRISRPHPDEAVALDDRIAWNRRKALHTLPRHCHGLAVAAHLQAVVAAYELAFAHPSQRQRCAAVGAEVLERSDPPFGAAKEHHRFIADAAAQRFFIDLVWSAGDVPSVFWEHQVTSSGWSGKEIRRMRNVPFRPPDPNRCAVSAPLKKPTGRFVR